MCAREGVPVDGRRELFYCVLSMCGSIWLGFILVCACTIYMYGFRVFSALRKFARFVV